MLVFIHSLASGGAERVTANLSNFWAARGWTVTVVTMTGPERDFYVLRPDIRRIALGLDARSGNALSGLRHNVQRVRALRKVLRREWPDVAVGMMTHANCLLALAAEGTGITAVGSERIHPPELPLGRSWEWVRRRTYPRLAALVALSTESASWLRRNAGARRVRIIPNPVIYPLGCHEPRVPPGKAAGHAGLRHTLLAVGRLDGQKGFDRLISAFAKLAPDFRDWCLAIVGEGDSRHQLEEQVAALHLRNSVFLPGVVGNIAEWYEAADLYVMTSRFEGFPNTLVEALAYGLPAVSVDCKTGPREILRHGIDGLLVPQGNEPALVDALARLMKDDDARRRCAANAVAVRERFSVERVAGMWEDLFAESRSKKW